MKLIRAKLVRVKTADARWEKTGETPSLLGEILCIEYCIVVKLASSVRNFTG